VPRVIEQLAANFAESDALAEEAERIFRELGNIEELTLEPVQGYAVRIYTETAAPVPQRLSEPEIGSAYAAGRAMSYTEAASFALNAVAETAPL